jgi:hypothetical protein
MQFVNADRQHLREPPIPCEDSAGYGSLSPSVASVLWRGSRLSEPYVTNPEDQRLSTVLLVKT